MKRAKPVRLKSQRETDRRTVLVWRLVLAAAGCLAVFAAMGQSVFWNPAVCLGVTMGLLAGAALQSPLWGPVVASAFAAVLMVAFRPWFAGEDLAVAVATVVGCAAIAGAASGWLSAKSVRLVALGTVVVLCVIVVANSFAVNSTAPEGAASLFDRVSSEPVTGQYTTDQDGFLKAFYLMHRGVAYYPAYRASLDGDASDETPFSPFNIRQPALFWLWSLLPASGRWIYVALLPFVLVTLVSGFFLVAAIGGDALGLIAAVLLMPVAIMSSATELGGLVEPWALAPAMASVALVAWRPKLGDTALWAAVACALCAALLREIFVLYLIAGVVASLFSKSRRDTMAWGFGFAAFFVAYAAHYLVAARYVSTSASRTAGHWLNGGVAWLMSTMRVGQDVMLGAEWLPATLVVLGLLAIALAVRPNALKLHLLVATVIPSIAFLFVGIGMVNGQASGTYWGLIYAPLAIACAPLVLRLGPLAVPEDAAATRQ